MPKANIIVLVLWSLPLLAWVLPRVAAAVIGLLRARGERAALFGMLVVAACIYAYPSSAQKGGGTNGPVEIPAMDIPAFRIMLYHESARDRFYPIGSPLREVLP